MFDPLNSQDDFDTPRNEPLLLEVLKEHGENSKYKPNHRKKAEKKSNTTAKGAETRSSKIDQ